MSFSFWTRSKIFNYWAWWKSRSGDNKVDIGSSGGESKDKHNFVLLIDIARAVCIATDNCWCQVIYWKVSKYLSGSIELFIKLRFSLSMMPNVSNLIDIHLLCSFELIFQSLYSLIFLSSPILQHVLQFHMTKTLCRRFRWCIINNIINYLNC